jgi:hypothetical protein
MLKTSRYQEIIPQYKLKEVWTCYSILFYLFLFERSIIIDQFASVTKICEVILLQIVNINISNSCLL